MKCFGIFRFEPLNGQVIRHFCISVAALGHDWHLIFHESDDQITWHICRRRGHFQVRAIPTGRQYAPHKVRSVCSSWSDSPGRIQPWQVTCSSFTTFALTIKSPMSPESSKTVRRSTVQVGVAEVKQQSVHYHIGEKRYLAN
jgi:hypothetical protein